MHPDQMPKGRVGDTDSHDREEGYQWTLSDIVRNASQYAEELRALREHVHEYEKLRKLFLDAGYKIEEHGNRVQVYKEV